jgi:hypothetical protein
MWGEIIQLLISLPVAAALFFLVPRRATRAWAIWLVVCLMAVSLQGIAQEVYTYYHQDRLYLLTKDNQLEFQKDEAGEVASVMVNNPPEGVRTSRPRQQPVLVTGSSLLLAVVILVLLLRGEPAAGAPKPSAPRSVQGIGISILAFGLVVLIGAMVEAITSRSGTGNLLGVVVMASGYYVSRGSRLAAKWALALTALLGALVLLFVVLIAFGGNADIMGRQIQPGETPWAITIGLAVTAWAAINLFLTVRFLSQTAPAGSLHE